MKHSGFWAGLGLIAALAAPVAAQDATAPTADTIVATVNGIEITLGHMVVLRNSLPAQYQELPDDVLFKGILDQLVQQSTLEQSLEGNLSKRDRLAIENDRRGYLSGVAIEAVVRAAVTDEALQAAYDARYKDAAPVMEYNAAHILVDAEDKAQGLLAELDGGADFAALAREHSTDTGSGANGGELGWFGTGTMVQPFEDAVVAAEVGKVAGPVQTNFGWHLVLVRETRISEAPTLDDLRDELAAEIEQKAVEAHIASLTAGATVTRPGEGIDPALLRDLTLLDE